jgi:hypothetical protein
VPFVGALDAFVALLTGVWSMLRLLVSSYTGPLVRLRRISDSAVQDFYPLANGRVDVAAILTFKGASSLVVAYVYDQFGGNNWTQSSGAMQPEWVESLADFNGAPAMYLGSAAGMECSLPLPLPFTVLLTECNPTAMLFLHAGRTLDEMPPYVGSNKLISSGRAYSGQAYDDAEIVAPQRIDTAVCEVLTAPSGGVYSFYNDGVDVTTGSVTTHNWGANGIALGKSGLGNETAQSNVAEIVTFNTALDSTQVTAMQTIFNPATL